MTAGRVVALVWFVVAGIAVSSCGAPQRDVPHRPDPARIPLAQPTSPVKDPSAEDAVRAAVRFVCSGQRLLDTPASQLAEVVGSMWSTAAADGALGATLESLSGLRERLEQGSGPTRFRQSVLAVRVESHTTSRAVVSVWWVGVLSREGAVVPQAQWSTSTVTMVAGPDGWDVDAETTEAGPVPDHSVDAGPVGHADFERRLAGFVDWEQR